MTSRRGLPDEVYSDNGTNFICADRGLQALLAQVESHKIEESLANKGVKWHFNTPLAPHWRSSRINGEINEKGDKSYSGTG